MPIDSLVFLSYFLEGKRIIHLCKNVLQTATTLCMEQLLLEQSNDYFKKCKFSRPFFLITLKGKWKVAGSQI